MQSEARPSTVMVPSASTVAMSPGSAHRSLPSFDERRRRLDRITEVADGDVTSPGQMADDTRARWHRLKVGVEHVWCWSSTRRWAAP